MFVVFDMNRVLKIDTERINLVYWNVPNFGDFLGPYIVSKLSDKKIVHKTFYHGLINSIKQLIYSLIHFDLKGLKCNLYFWENNLLSVGSILGWGNKKSVVWGSGFISENQSFRGGTICALRGKYSDIKLREEGFQGSSVYGDPALLLPLFFSPNVTKTQEIAIIPHCSETDFFIEKLGNKYKIIDLRTTKVEKVITEITSCKKVLSTSLHGLIVSHAYGIPALWIRNKKLHNSNFKFFDYFSSVGIEEYEGFLNIDEILFSESSYNLLFDQNKDKCLPNVDLKSIQKALLCAAPFEVKDIFFYKLQSCKNE